MPSGMNVVASICSTMAGPLKRSPASRRSRSYTGQFVKPWAPGNQTGRYSTNARAPSQRVGTYRAGGWVTRKGCLWHKVGCLDPECEHLHRLVIEREPIKSQKNGA